MRDLNDLQYFVLVVEHGGFSSAERAVGIPKSRLSRRLAALEESLGVQLIQRSTRHISLTEIGKAYYQRCVAMIAEADAAADLIEYNRAEPSGLVRISCPPQLLHFVVSNMLVSFLQKYPKVKLEIKSIGRRVDLDAEGLDLAIRVRFEHEDFNRWDVYDLSESPQKLLAAPSLLDLLPTVQSPEELINMPVLDWERHSIKWEFRHADGTKKLVATNPLIRTDDLSTLHKAALSGLGVVQLPLLLTLDDINSGTLIEVLPEWQLPMGIVQAVLPRKRILIPSVKALLAHLTKSFGKYDVDTIAK